ASWRRLTSLHSPLHRWQLALHVWCARWFTDGGAGADATEIRAVIDALVRGDRTLTDARLEAHKTEAASIARSHGFFHWPLEFPDVFADRRRITEGGPGFDAVIGNAPWEMVRRDDGHDVDVRRLLTFVRQSGLFPSCTHGHLNLYQAFVDRSLSV